MVVKKISDVAKTEIKEEGAKFVTRQILIGQDDGSNGIIMRLFTLAPGGHTLHHTHDFEHLVKVEKGKGIAISEKGETKIQAGDVVYVRPNEIHQFRNDSSEEFQFVCVIPNRG